MKDSQMWKPQIVVATDMQLCMEALELLRQAGTVKYLVPPDRERTLQAIGDAYAYLGNIDILINRSFLEHAPQLQVICTCSTGTDHIDIPAVEERGITLFSIKREYELLESFSSVAETTWGLLIACLRHLPYHAERARHGELRWWASEAPLPYQLSGKTLGVLGVGRLGSMVVEYGKAFRMRVLGCDVRTRDIDGMTQVDFDTLIRESDIISIHVHLTDETRHVINRDVLARMKRGAVLLNTARGDIIDEDAFVDALESEHLLAAAVDVYHNEWDPNIASHRLFEYARNHHNLIITPHLAGASFESITGARVFMARKLAAFLRNAPKNTKAS